MEPTVVCFGEMLWDMLPTGKQPGGAPMNVAVHLKNFGLNPVIVSRVGSDDLGQELLNFLRGKHLSTDYVQLGHTHLTGVVKVNVSDQNEVTYKIVQPVAWDYIQYSEELGLLVSQADVLVYGSLAARSQASSETLYQLLEKALLKVFDVNLRPPYYSQSSVESLMQQADIVKINHHELAEVIGWYDGPIEEKEAMRFLRDRFGLQAVCLTRGANGAALLEGDEYYEHPGFPITVADTIGSGDSFLAAFLHLYLDGAPTDRILSYACAVGAYVATQRGATPPVPEEFIYALISNPSNG
jgi:fructokinase